MMNRHLRTLGLALFAALALTAVVASAASAANYTASSYPVTSTAESALGNDTFTTEAGKVECKSHYGNFGTMNSPTLTVTAGYTNCKAFGFLEAKVEMGSCDYLFAEPTGSGDNWSAGVSVKCTNSASPITITAGTCKVTVGEQTLGGSTAITNNTAAGDASAKANVTGIGYTVVTDGFACPFAGTGAKTGATYAMDTAITYDSTGGQTVDVG